MIKNWNFQGRQKKLRFTFYRNQKFGIHIQYLALPSLTISLQY